MAQLAITGHATRGSEVIALLEMLGGKNIYNSCGVFGNRIYTIDEKTDEIIDVSKNRYSDYNIFSLEEFLEKFPYKVGDNVMIDQYACTILSCWWDESVDEVAYCVKGVDFQVTTYVRDLQPYKEQETMEEKDEKSVNHVFDTGIISFDIAQRDKYELDLQGKFEVVLREGKYYVERIKPQYPSSYEECCRIVNASPYVKLVYNFADGQTYSYDVDNLHIYGNLRRLRICRDAYWKIVGEEMGLGKPWEPDWNNVCDKYTIYTVYGNEIWRDTGQTKNTLLAFPTKEMRDAFYENFKDLIETCKELL